MTRSATDVLHTIHTATNDVLKGYREMHARAEPEIQPVIRRLTDMHVAHAADQEAELARRRDAANDDSSLQGTVNKVVVILRDWLSRMDRDVLPAVREGEESLLEEYSNALKDDHLGHDPAATALLTRQMDEIRAEVARLPKD